MWSWFILGFHFNVYQGHCSWDCGHRELFVTWRTFWAGGLGTLANGKRYRAQARHEGAKQHLHFRCFNWRLLVAHYVFITYASSVFVFFCYPSNPHARDTYVYYLLKHTPTLTVTIDVSYIGKMLKDRVVAKHLWTLKMLTDIRRYMKILKLDVFQTFERFDLFLSDFVSCRSALTCSEAAKGRKSALHLWHQGFGREKLIGIDRCCQIC